MPNATGVTTPVEEPTVATPALLLAQMPPGMVLLNVYEEPVHIFGLPMMAGGVGITVISFVALHPPNIV